MRMRHNLLDSDRCDQIDHECDSETEICILLPDSRNSLWVHICGRGPHPNCHMIDATAPSALNTLEPAVWSRFYTHAFMAHMKSLRCVSTLYLLLIFHSIFMANIATGHIYPVIMLLASIGCYYENWREYRLSGQLYRRVVTKMKPTFQAQGFQVEFVEAALCTCDRIFTGRWVRFTPIHSVLRSRKQAGGNDEEQQDVSEEQQVQLGTFNPEDWKPLEGQWEMNDPSKMTRDMPWLLQLKSMTWTFQNTTSEETFESFMESQSNMCFSLWPREVITREYKLQGNTLKVEQITLQPTRVMGSRVRTILEGEVYVPIPMENRTIRSLYKKQQNTIILVQHLGQGAVSTLKLIEFEFEEDTPNDGDLAAGILDNLTKTELQDMGGVVRLHLERTNTTIV